LSWLYGLFFPALAYLLGSISFPSAVIFLSSAVALVVAVVVDIRGGERAVFWVLLPMAVTHAVVFAVGLAHGWGGVVCAVVEILAIGWMIWSTRRNWIVALCATFFTACYAYVPFLFGLGFASI
jgi:hypothetical protein